MSGARAAAKKKPQSCSPHKRKTLNSNSTHNLKLLNRTKSTGKFPEPSNDTKCADIRDSEPKRMRIVGSHEKITELKKKVSLLKKKPADFDPTSISCCEKGEPVPFLFLYLAFDMIDDETGQIVSTDIVCNMLSTIMNTTPEDLVAVVYLLANQIAPSHKGLKLGIGDASIIKALAEACGRSKVQIKNQYKEKGDLGLVAKASRSSQPMMRKPDPLTIRKVFDTFGLIAEESGEDSQGKKENHIKGLLVAAIDCETQYLIRLLQSKLRIGFAEQTLLAALG